MKKFISMVMVVLIILFTAVPAFATDAEKDYTALIEECINNKNIAHEMAECARALGYAEDHVIIKTASARWWEEENKQKEYEQKLVEASKPVEDDSYVVSDEKKAEYPYASQVWEFLKNDMELNDYVAAGILGNMMAECGGQTLALQPFIYTRGYYGLCMWYVSYTPQVSGQDVAGQLNVLKDTCKKNIEYFGGDYDYFCSLANEVDAAWYFTKYYERGAWHSIRGKNATDALNYFAS